MENKRLITFQDLIDLKTELLREIRAISPPAKPPKKWLKSLDVRKRLGLSAGKLQNMRNNNEITFTRIGGIIYYLEEEIDKMLESNSNLNAKQ